MRKMRGYYRISEQTHALVRISSSNSFSGMLGDRYFIDWIGFWSGHFCGWFKIGIFGGWDRFHGWERTWHSGRSLREVKQWVQSNRRPYAGRCVTLQDTLVSLRDALKSPHGCLEEDIELVQRKGPRPWPWIRDCQWRYYLVPSYLVRWEFTPSILYIYIYTQVK